jgi:hypothetical protein
MIFWFVIDFWANAPQWEASFCTRRFVNAGILSIKPFQPVCFWAVYSPIFGTRQFGKLAEFSEKNQK